MIANETSILTKINEFKIKLRTCESEQDKFILYSSFCYNHMFSAPELINELNEEGIAYFREHPNKLFVNVLYLNTIAYYFHSNDFDSFIDLQLSCLDFFKKKQYHEYYIRSLGNLINIFERLNMHNHISTMNKELLMKAIAINSDYMKAMVKTNMILYYDKLYKLDTLDEAIFLDLIHFCKNADATVDLALGNLYQLFGKSYLLKKDYKKALEYFELCKQVQEKLSDNYLLFYYYLSMFEYFESQKNVPRQSKYALLTYEFLLGHDFNIYFDEIYFEKLSKFFSSQKDFKRAFYFKETVYNYKKKHKEEELKIRQKLNILHDKHIVDLSENEKFKKNFFSFECIYVQNIKNELISLPLERIIYIEAYDRLIKIYFIDGEYQIFKINLKNFYQKLVDTNNHTLFFFPMNRLSLVNLYWYYDIDPNMMVLTLFVTNKSYKFAVSKRQHSELKKKFKIKT